LKVRNDDIESQVRVLKEGIISLGKGGNNNVSEKANNLQKIIKEIEEKDNLRHRIDLVTIEEGYENLVTNERTESGKEAEKPIVAEKTFIIGFNNQEISQEYQAQIEINHYQKK